MSKAKHTPGEWVKNGVNINANNRVTYLARGNGALYNEFRANAQLIAAAPDLLKACIDLINSIPPWDIEDEDKEMLNPIKAAIEKATQA